MTPPDATSDPRRCTGHRKNGQKCQGWRTPGSDKCRRHLFNPKAKAKAAVRAEVLAWGLTDTILDPGEVLLRLVSQSAARAQRYAAELEELVAASPSLREALVGETWIGQDDGATYKAGEYIRGLAQLEAQERDRCANFATKAIAAGLAERQVRLAERQGALIAEVLRAVVNDPTLGLSDEQRRVAPNVIRTHLLGIAG